MPTKEIGAGTINTSTNWIADEWSIWQWFFRQRGGASSLNAAKKDWMLEKLREDEPELAWKIEVIRAERERMKRGAVAGSICLLAVLLGLLQNAEIQRALRLRGQGRTVAAKQGRRAEEGFDLFDFQFNQELLEEA